METTKINLNAALEAKIQEVIEEKKQLHLEYPEMAENDDFAIPSTDKKYWKKTHGFEYRLLQIPYENEDILDAIAQMVAKEDIDCCNDIEMAYVRIWVPRNGEYKKESDALNAVANNISSESYSFEMISLKENLREIAKLYLMDCSKSKRNDGNVGKGWDNW